MLFMPPCTIPMALLRAQIVPKVLLRPGGQVPRPKLRSDETVIVVEGKQYEVLGVRSLDFIDSVALGLPAKSFRPRKTGWVRNICIHTRMGKSVQRIEQEPKNHYWVTDYPFRVRKRKTSSGCHIGIDGDGSFVCYADLARHATHHAGHVNDVSIGIELYQGADGHIHQATLRSCVLVCDVITRVMGIQRQVCDLSNQNWRFASPTGRFSWRRSKRLAYMRGGREAKRFVGIYGHRNVTRNRGRGDPGDAIMDLFTLSAGYERVQRDISEVPLWQVRQDFLGIPERRQDGIPGPEFIRHAIDMGYAHGMWVWRPGDGPARPRLL